MASAGDGNVITLAHRRALPPYVWKTYKYADYTQHTLMCYDVTVGLTRVTALTGACYT